MPGFAGHTIANSLVLLGTTAHMISDHWSMPEIVAVDAGILISTLVLSPDMDLYTSRSMEDWGPLKIFWWPYARIVKHRDELHTPVLGTSVRWMYTFAILFLLITLNSYLSGRLGMKKPFSFTDLMQSAAPYLGYLGALFIGANIADAVHFVLDVFTHGLKHGEGQFHPHYRHRF